MRFEALGPLRVLADGEPRPIGGPQHRVLLGLLLVRRTPVADEDIAEELWGRRAVGREEKNAIQVGVHHLRHRLRDPETERLVRQSGGYRLIVTDDEYDVATYRQTIRSAVEAARRDDLDDALELFDRAERLWRGGFLEDVRPGPWLSAYADALTESRLSGREAHLEARCRNGDADAITALREMARANPGRESTWYAYISALHRLDRPSQALAAYEQIRRHLVEKLGVEPGTDLRALRNEVARGVHPLQSPGRVPEQMSPPVTTFSGRAEQLAHLDTLLDRLSAARSGTIISVLPGPPGIGKTATALQWADRHRNRFPDGRLYADLRRFHPYGDPFPILGRFLAAFGVPDTRIPTDTDARSALFRSIVSERRVLILLDDARDADQVRPLLPGSSSCLTLVTSRNPLLGLVAAENADLLTVPELSAIEARELMARQLGADRLEAEPSAVDRIVRACAGLPLALCLVAARAAIGESLTTIAEHLEKPNDSRSVHGTGEPDSGARAVLSWSYDLLDPAAARLFRLLGLHPASTMSPSAAASIADLPLPETVRLLTDLARVRLIAEEQGRYGLHDLLRSYARDLLAASESAEARRAAELRMLDHYLHSAQRGHGLHDPAREVDDHIAGYLDTLGLVRHRSDPGEVT